jgi:hypothetical protein
VVRRLDVQSYIVRVATMSQGFNEWRANITFRTPEPGTITDLRFVDDPSTLTQFESVQETGPSQVYLPYTAFADVLRVVQGEGPLSLVLYGDANRVLLESGDETPGDLEHHGGP